MSVLDRLEPETREYGKAFSVKTEEAGIMSIAISLKRIADEVCGVPYDHAPGADNSKHRSNLTDAIATAIEQSILSASRR